MDAQIDIIWTDYMRYRAKLRGFDIAKIEHIMRYSSERYVDTATGRTVVVGRHDNFFNNDHTIPVKEQLYR